MLRILAAIIACIIPTTHAQYTQERVMNIRLGENIYFETTHEISEQVSFKACHPKENSVTIVSEGVLHTGEIKGPFIVALRISVGDTFVLKSPRSRHWSIFSLQSLRECTAVFSQKMISTR
jgi:hypothetical protein